MKPCSSKPKKSALYDVKSAAWTLFNVNAVVASAVLAVGVVSGATAATVNFSASPAVQGPSLSQTVDGVTLTATGFSYTPTSTIGSTVTLGAQADVIIGNQGLGVCDDLSPSSSALVSCGQPLVDAVSNNGGPELASFAFSKAVNILSVTFNQNDNNDDVDLYAGSPLALVLRDTSSLSGGPTGDVISLAGNAAFEGILNFGVGIFDFGPNGNNSDQVRIASIEFEAVNVVPLPAGAVLLFTALGGLGFMRRRRG
ncbi:putative secreted protein [Primorskyibacter sedentarius]|uniref:Putative secreted protein n=2 Tax=Primorskyibacter sedentarius TaxID=745311 RepID=A0A4R3J464_9RHOB|nr:putative secreted protein [Primorskyibacter sedentarius]